MSDNVNTAAPIAPPIEVTRNDVTIPFKWNEKTRGSAEVDPTEPFALVKGSKYPAPEVTEENLSQVISWVGTKIIVKKIGALLNQWAQGVTEEVLAQKEGSFDESVFSELAKQFSARGEPMKELLDQRLELVQSLSDLTDEELGTEKGIKKMLEIRTEIKSLNVAIASKKRMTKEEKLAAAANGNGNGAQ